MRGNWVVLGPGFPLSIALLFSSCRKNQLKRDDTILGETSADATHRYILFDIEMFAHTAAGVRVPEPKKEKKVRGEQDETTRHTQETETQGGWTKERKKKVGNEKIPTKQQRREKTQHFLIWLAATNELHANQLKRVPSAQHASTRSLPKWRLPSSISTRIFQRLYYFPDILFIQHSDFFSGNFQFKCASLQWTEGKEKACRQSGPRPLLIAAPVTPLTAVSPSISKSLASAYEIRPSVPRKFPIRQASEPETPMMRTFFLFSNWAPFLLFFVASRAFLILNISSW